MEEMQVHSSRGRRRLVEHHLRNGRVADRHAISPVGSFLPRVHKVEIEDVAAVFKLYARLRNPRIGAAVEVLRGAVEMRHEGVDAQEDPECERCEGNLVFHGYHGVVRAATQLQFLGRQEPLGERRFVGKSTPTEQLLKALQVAPWKNAKQLD